MIRAVLFDLDGTLLPMDQDEFTKGYFGLLAKKLAPLGYEPKGLVDAIWAGTKAMVENDGRTTNEIAFWNRFGEIYGLKSTGDMAFFDEFYRVEFQETKSFCGCNPKAAETVKQVKALGLRVALATNPIFPATATESRIRWAGLEPGDFEFYTTYENTNTCKPNPEYYREAAHRLGLPPEECLMVGNDVTEDMVARTVGMSVFLLTDCLINKEREDINQFPRGSFEQVIAFIASEMARNKS